MPEDRKCSECGCDIKLDSKTGVCSDCYPKWYKKVNKERLRELNKLKYAANREEKLAKAKAAYDPAKKKLWRKKYYEDNKAREIERSNTWRDKFKEENPEKWQQQVKTRNERQRAKPEHAEYCKRVKERRKQYQKQYRVDNRERLNAKHRERYNSDIQFRLSNILRVRLNEAIGNNQKSGSAVRDLGCSIAELKAHLESMFYPDPLTGTAMTWDNWGLNDGCWQIDHVKPLIDFDLSDPEQLKAACNYKNLRPLWHCDHLVKSIEERKRGMESAD